MLFFGRWLLFLGLLPFVIQPRKARTEIARGNIIDNLDGIVYLRHDLLPP
jgi:hypothetical protein